MTQKETISGPLRDTYLKGKDAFDKRNYPYAIALLSGVVEAAPGYREARNLLRSAEIGRFESGGNPLLKKLLAIPTLVPRFFKAYMCLKKGKWEEALRLYESILRKDPFNRIVLAQLARAAMNLNLVPVAIDSYEQIRRQNPKDVRALKALGRIYVNQADYERARRYFDEVRRLVPHDAEAIKGIKDIAAMKTIEDGGWDDSASYRSKIRDEKQAVLFEQETRMARSEEDLTDLISTKEEELSQQPENLIIVKTLAELYVEQGDFDKAINAYQMATMLNPGDFSLQELVMDTKIRKLDHRIEQLRESGEPGAEQQIVQLESDKRGLVLEERKKRVDHYPNNLAYRYDFAESLYEKGAIDEAIQQFQLSVNDPQRRIRALNYLGLCFRKKKLYDLSIKQFARAEEQLRDMDAFKKEVVYNLGLAFEEAGNHDKAMAQFQKIYEVDIGYRDVQKKIEKTR